MDRKKRKKISKTQILIILIAWGLICLCSCKGNNEDKTTDLRILQQFERDIKQSIDKRNSQGDSISNEIVLDTVDIKKIGKKDYQMVLAQYHTSDNRMDMSIIGIDNFSDKDAPTYLLVDDRTEKLYSIESIKIISDSLHIYIAGTLNGKREKLEISFDLNFNGKSFPWNSK